MSEGFWLRFMIVAILSADKNKYLSTMVTKNTKIWNEDLVNALRMREDMSRKAGKRDQITWKQGAESLESVRKDIYAVRKQARLCLCFYPYV